MTKPRYSVETDEVAHKAPSSTRKRTLEDFENESWFSLETSQEVLMSEIQDILEKEPGFSEWTKDEFGLTVQLRAGKQPKLFIRDEWCCEGKCGEEMSNKVDMRTWLEMFPQETDLKQDLVKTAIFGDETKLPMYLAKCMHIEYKEL